MCDWKTDIWKKKKQTQVQESFDFAYALEFTMFSYSEIMVENILSQFQFERGT